MYSVNNAIDVNHSILADQVHGENAYAINMSNDKRKSRIGLNT